MKPSWVGYQNDATAKQSQERHLEIPTHGTNERPKHHKLNKDQHNADHSEDLAQRVLSRKPRSVDEPEDQTWDQKDQSHAYTANPPSLAGGAVGASSTSTDVARPLITARATSAAYARSSGVVSRTNLMAAGSIV